MTTPSRSYAQPGAALRWFGPAVGPADASVIAGLIWFAALVGALWVGALAFGLLVTATGALGAWQAAAVRSRPAAGAAQRRQAGQRQLEALPLHHSHRLPAATLAGSVGCAAILDTRLAGAVTVAAVAASFIVVGALRTGGRAGDAPSAVSAVVVRAVWFIRAWAQVGIAAGCAAAIARHALGAALVLVIAASAYDAAAYVVAAGRSTGLRGQFAGMAAAACAVFALTGVSVPPLAPSDAVRFGALAAVACPLGPVLARSMTAFARRPTHLPAGASLPQRSAASAAHSGRRRRRAMARLDEEWAVRRIDSLSVASPAWMWALGLLAV